MSWLVIPNPSKPCRWMLVDTLETEKPTGRGRVVGQFDDELRARVVADLLADWDADYRRDLATLERLEPF